ncbi:MAG: LysR family transcriptional regulator [Gammaproteobacteria bacterium]|nr:LysR family transcriptional regulator [Gammaproteobacteria bacterium]
MDLELLKTFLEVHRVRHFGKAADNLFITPSAVSARIQHLEDQLGVTLFNRSRNNIHLTEAGERLLNHAKTLLNAWEKARYDVVAGAGSAMQLTVLAVPSLWDTLLLPWLTKVRLDNPDTVLRIESVPSDVIWRKLQQNQADLGFVFEPHAGPELHIVEHSSLELNMVATQANLTANDVVCNNYVMVDWGASFMTRHAALFPDASIPHTSVSTGRIAYDLLQSGGDNGCYLPEFMIKDAIKKRTLFQVKEAPAIRLPVYAAYPVWSLNEELITQLLTIK